MIILFYVIFQSSFRFKLFYDLILKKILKLTYLDCFRPKSQILREIIWDDNFFTSVTISQASFDVSSYSKEKRWWFCFIDIRHSIVSRVTLWEKRNQTNKRSKVGYRTHSNNVTFLVNMAWIYSNVFKLLNFTLCFWNSIIILFWFFVSFLKFCFAFLIQI